MPLAVTAASFLPALFGGGDDDVDKALASLEKEQAHNRATAAARDSEGSALMAPVKKYLGDVMSGDRNALLQATMPERRRVVDQYDTAKKAIAEFAPRGGGLAGSLAQVNAGQASDLAEIGANARTQGFEAAGNLAMQIRQLGVSAQQLSSMNLNSLIETVMKQSDQKHESLLGMGEALGTVIGMSLPRG